jgi:hypothetical protein
LTSAEADPGILAPAGFPDDIWEWSTRAPTRGSPTAQLYRYVGIDEAISIRDSGCLERGGQLWLTPDYYNDPDEAQRKLALPGQIPPAYRVGPIWALDVVFDGVPLSIAPARFGQPGGGWQVSTTRRIPFGERYKL